MKKNILLLSLIVLPLSGFAQTTDSIQEPLIPNDKADFLKNIYMSLDMRMSFRKYTLRGEGHDYRGNQFQNGFTALNIKADLHDKVTVNFRNRFNKGTDLQSLDQLGNNIELANINVKVTPDFNLRLGKQDAYFGGFEYSFSGLDVLIYNDIQSNALSYVTGVGGTYDASDNHSFGVQVLNSRTILYEDKYGDAVADNIKEPNWPVEFVGRWTGTFFDGKLETRYSYSYSREVKNKGTHYVTLGHKYENDRLKLMYDFDYSVEQVDTKGVATDIIDTEQVAQDVIYIENWVRGEYRISSELTGLITLMTSRASTKKIKGQEIGRKHLRTSYGAIPTLYYSPFDDIDLRFFVAYIGRFYNYSNFAKGELGATDYNRNEVRFGFISPMRIL